MDGQNDRWMDEMTDGWTNKQTNEQMNEQTNKYKYSKAIQILNRHPTNTRWTPNGHEMDTN